MLSSVKQNMGVLASKLSSLLVMIRLYAHDLHSPVDVFAWAKDHLRLAPLLRRHCCDPCGLAYDHNVRLSYRNGTSPHSSREMDLGAEEDFFRALKERNSVRAM